MLLSQFPQRLQGHQVLWAVVEGVRKMKGVFDAKGRCKGPLVGCAKCDLVQIVPKRHSLGLLQPLDQDCVVWNRAHKVASLLQSRRGVVHHLARARCALERVVQGELAGHKVELQAFVQIAGQVHLAQVSAQWEVRKGRTPTRIVASNGVFHGLVRDVGRHNVQRHGFVPFAQVPSLSAAEIEPNSLFRTEQLEEQRFGPVVQRFHPNNWTLISRCKPIILSTFIMRFHMMTYSTFKFY